MTPEQRTERMAKRLNLTSEQKAQVLALNTEYADVLNAPRMRGPRPDKKQATDGTTGASEQQPKQEGQKGQRPERPQMSAEQRAEMKQHFEKRKEYDNKLKGILTQDQYKEYKKMQPKHHGHKGGRPEKKD